ncbi:activating signal cointegrator 1-like [Macrosteles quadrilineatus]|uniref:activating signal cointegrator 1-like n=1 Tax=Macrosteles quadrilineatus TaxID=74068 RepID=UPI0023E13EAA|nr:activating signal cointegrator 1-like [Macrosteles quadrilineatus]
MADQGLCLRVDQPAAGLLVCGIKKFKGYPELFTHRGRLWITASDKEATLQEIREAEAFYMRTRGTILFPSGYQRSYLIGCVDVVNCITHSDYTNQHPEHPETDSDYVLVCQNPRCLPRLQFHNPGTETLFKLDPLVHAAAVKVLNSQQPNQLLGKEFFMDGKK